MLYLCVAKQKKIKQCAKLQLFPDSRSEEWVKRLYILDSTTITLFSNIHKGAGRNPKIGKKKGGIKAHTVIKAAENVPCLVRFTSAATRSDIESAVFEGEGIHIDDLQKGDRIEVTWLPNRRCVFRYEGEAHFTIEEAENAKLHVGDSFEAVCFIIGKPMYLDDVQRDDNNVQSTKEGFSYVAGSKHGLNSVRKLS